MKNRASKPLKGISGCECVDIFKKHYLWYFSISLDKGKGADSIFCALSVHGVVCWWAAGNESG